VQGKFIVIEGLEGAGKSTAIETVITHLKSKGIADVITTREPGGTPIAEALRDIIKGNVFEEKIFSQTELLLMYAARVQLLNLVIKPAIDNGCWVVADRFELSTFAYQGAGRGLELNFIEELSRFCLNDFSPDLTLYLDIEPGAGLQRVEQRGQKDRIEQEPLDFFERIRACYQKKVCQNPKAVTIDAHKPLEQVKKTIIESLDVLGLS